MSMEYLKKTDDVVYDAIKAEEERERNKLPAADRFGELRESCSDGSAGLSLHQ